MFQPRTLSDIQMSFFQTLLSENTALSDINPGSSLYTIGRAIATLQSETDLTLLNTSNTFFIDTAAGPDLDIKAADFRITRKPGTYAIGYILAISQTSPFSVDPGVIFTDPITKLQFQVTGTLNQDVYSVSPYTEIKIPIQCTVVGLRGNIAAGTKLISPTFPQGKFVVAIHRTTAGQYCGDMAGGVDPESDSQLRARLQNTLLYSRSTTDLSIESLLLGQELVPWVNVQVPVPGVIQVWVDNSSTLSSSQLSQLQQLANTVRPAGTLLTLQQVTRYLIDINVQVVPDWTVDLQTLTADITGTVQVYLSQLSISQPLSVIDLTNSITALKGVSKASLITPASDVTPPVNQVVRTNAVQITYETT